MTYPSEVDNFIMAKCRLALTPGLFVALYRSTGGDPCRTGCAYFENGGCPAFKQLFPGVTVPSPKKVKKRDDAALGYVAPNKKPFRW